MGIETIKDFSAPTLEQLGLDRLFYLAIIP
jgi:hypothetical protein